MRRIRYSMFAFIFVTSSLVAAEPKDTILLSDSFESGEDTPEGWQKSAAIPGVKHVYDQRNAADGKRSLSLQKSAKRYFPIAQWFKLVNCDGKHPALQISVKVKAAKATKAIVDAQFLDANGAMLSHAWLIYIGQKEDTDPVASHNWKTYEGEAEIPAGTKQIAIALQIYGPGSVWFDDLRAQYKDAQGGKSSKPAEASQKPASPPLETAEPPKPIDVKTTSGAMAQYLVVPPDVSAEKPAAGYPVLLVLPGGDGSAEFHPFVRSIQQQALKGRYIVVEPIAPYQIVWPTKSGQFAQPTTEEAIDAIIADVAGRFSINRQQIYALAWSSSGPAIYATLLQQQSPLAGAMIAMSVFKPEQLPPLRIAKGRRVYLLHSPADKVCPYQMAMQAQQQLASAGAAVKLVDYEGGHGWHGPIFDQIRDGLDWLHESR